MMENKKRPWIIVVVGILLIGDVFFGLNYYLTWNDLQAIEATESKVELNQKVVNFISMFIKDVLQANRSVDFDTRLSLENAVRDLHDDQIMAEWQNFTGSKTEADAQNSVKILLGLLISKIQK